MDSYSRELLIDYVETVRETNQYTRDHKDLYALLAAVLSVIGAKKKPKGKGRKKLSGKSPALRKKMIQTTLLTPGQNQQDQEEKKEETKSE